MSTKRGRNKPSCCAAMVFRKVMATTEERLKLAPKFRFAAQNNQICRYLRGARNHDRAQGIDMPTAFLGIGDILKWA